MKIKRIAKGTQVGEYTTRLPTWGIVDEKDQVIHILGRLSGLPVPALYDRRTTAARDLHNLTEERIVG